MALGHIITGATGNVSIPQTALRFKKTGGEPDPQPVNARITRWSLSFTREEHDTTTFEVTNNFRTFVGGMASFTGRCEGYLDSSHFLDLPTALETEDQEVKADFVLKASEQGTVDRTYTFSALISGIELSIDKVAHSALSFNFRGSATDATVDFTVAVT